MQYQGLHGAALGVGVVWAAFVELSTCGRECLGCGRGGGQRGGRGGPTLLKVL